MAGRVTAARRRRPPQRSPAARRAATVRALRAVQRDIRALRLPGLVGAPVHGPPVPSRIYLLGQAPGPHEARLGRSFAWTAGKTLFRWFERACGASEGDVRERVYLAAVVRAFPGKTRAGGDRLPSPVEIAASRDFIRREVTALRPRLVVPVGRLAIEQVLGPIALAEAVGRRLRARYHGVACEVVCLPHPSGASTWFKTDPGRGLLERALRILARHPEMRRAFPRRRRGSAPRGGAARRRSERGAPVAARASRGTMRRCPLPGASPWPPP